MANLTQTDLNVRLQLIQYNIGLSINTLLNKIKIGEKDVYCKLVQLQTIQKMLNYIKCYDVITDPLAENNNCLTELELQTVIEYISVKLKIGFQFPGFTYQ